MESLLGRHWHQLPAAEALAAQGLRVLAFARKEFPATTSWIDHAEVESDLTFLGLQGMIDPPRPEAVEAIRACRQAGIAVKMITGDHPRTAAAVAAQLGLAGEGACATLTGKELAAVSDTDLIRVAEKTAVFARVSPEQKLRLVAALQARGHVVAMTGDGVNDAPALKQADIGVAMGITGTDVAKSAADIVLTDDNFASIEAAVEEGRGVFANLTKFIIWTLPTNVGQGLVILAAILLGGELPILPAQVLRINMTTALFLGLMLAFEPKEADAMRRPPRAPQAPILTGEPVLRIGSVGSLLLFGAFGLFEWELVYLFNCRSLTRSVRSVGLRSNPWAIAGAAAMLLAQLAFTYLPPMNLIFHSAPIPLQAWAGAVVIGLAAFVLVGAEKALRHGGTRRR
jgi:Ca2+-transporting ATPase